MALTSIPYQSLTYRTTEALSKKCGYCSVPVYLDKTEPLNIQLGLTPFNDVDILTTYGSGETLTNLTEAPAGTFCYDRAANSAYKGIYSIDISEGQPGGGGMADNQYNQVNFTYTSNVTFYCTIDLQTSTGTSITSQTFELPAAFSGMDVTKYLLCSVDDPAGYKIVITFYSSTIDDTASFCFTDLTAYVISQANAAAWVDCNGDETDLTGTSSTSFFGDMQLVVLDLSTLSGEGYIYLSDAYLGLSKIYSSLFNAIDPATFGLCRTGNLIKVLWREACNLENDAVAYSSIEYHFYVQGYTERLPLVTDERITVTRPGGRKNTVFNYSYAPVQIKVGVYGEDVHEIIERAVESSYVEVDGDEYQMDDGSTYANAAIGNGRFTGRVDMIKVGTERVLSSCCCPVEAVTVGCGELVITDICAYSTGLGLQGYYISYELDGLVTGSSIDVQFENVTQALNGLGCTTAAGTTYTVTAQGSIGGDILFDTADWDDVFDNNYCGDTDILYYMRIRVNCGATQGAWSDEFPFVPANLTQCESSR